MMESKALVAADGLGRSLIYSLYWDEVGALVKWSIPSLSIYMNISARLCAGITDIKPTIRTLIIHLIFIDLLETSSLILGQFSLPQKLS